MRHERDMCGTHIANLLQPLWPRIRALSARGIIDQQQKPLNRPVAQFAVNVMSLPSSTRTLIRRIEALGSTSRRAAPRKRNLLLEMSITAMALAWTPRRSRSDSGRSGTIEPRRPPSRPCPSLGAIPGLHLEAELREEFRRFAGLSGSQNRAVVEFS